MRDFQIGDEYWFKINDHWLCAYRIDNDLWQERSVKSTDMQINNVMDVNGPGIEWGWARYGEWLEGSMLS